MLVLHYTWSNNSINISAQQAQSYPDFESPFWNIIKETVWQVTEWIDHHALNMLVLLPNIQWVFTDLLQLWKPSVYSKLQFTE